MSVLRAMWGFDGRIGRKVFWLAALLWTIPFLALYSGLIHLLSGGQWLTENYGDTLEGVKATGLSVFLCLGIGLYPSLAMSVKRLHDLAFSAWWCVPAYSMPLPRRQASREPAQA